MSEQSTPTTTTPTNDETDSTTTEEPQETTPPDDEQPTGPEPADREAAKYRRRLRTAEAERDQAQAQLDAQRRAIIDWRATNAIDGAVDPALLDAAGINVADLLDDTGHLDMTAVDQFINTTATTFRVHRLPKPNPQQGLPAGSRPNLGLTAAFDPRNLSQR